MKGIIAAIALLPLLLTAGCGWWNVKPETVTAVELRRAACINQMYYATHRLPDGTHLDDQELDIRLSHLRHVMESRGLGTCEGVLP